MSPSPTTSTVVEIDGTLTAALRPAARARDLPVQRLVVELIETIARDCLVDAVLDDGRPTTVPPPRKVGRPPKP
jgi:hypothetical protein